MPPIATEVPIVPDFRSVLARQDGAIHRRQLRSLGIDRRRLAALIARGELEPAREHVFVARSAPSSWRRHAWKAAPGPKRPCGKTGR